MRAIISDNRWIYLDNVTPDVDELIYNHFAAQDPRARFIDSVEEQSWDGVYRKYRKKDQKLSIGFLSGLKRLCRKHDIPLDVVDQREPPKYPMFKEEDIKPDILSGITLMDHQIEGLKACTHSNVGHLWFTTGSGKCLTYESKIIINNQELEIGSLFDDFEEEEMRDVSKFDLFALGPNGHKRIQKLYKTNKRTIVEIELINGFKLRGVPEHRVFTKKGWKALQDLDGYDDIYTRKATDETSCNPLCEKEIDEISINRVRQTEKYGFFVRETNWQRIKNKRRLKTKENCYDIQIDDQSHAFWSSNILSHNTELMCGIAKLLKCPTIIIAEERVVVDQIKNRLSLRDVSDDIGLFYAGKTPNDQLVCVGSLASLMAPPRIKRKQDETLEKYEKRLRGYKTRIKNHKIYRKLLAKCELLMIDECDRVATNKQYKKIIQQYTNSRYIYGFTGTLPMEEDKLDLLNLTELLGEVIAKSDRRYLEKIGRIIPVKYIMTVFGEDRRNDRSAFDIAVKELIEENTYLHQKIKKITDAFPKENFLILVENIGLGEILESYITGSKFIHGTTSTKKRNVALKEFENKDLRILIGSKILKRGLDLNGGIDNLILVASSKKDSELEQKVGRAVRINERGWARVFDFLYVSNHHLYSHSRRRLKRMIQLGYPTIVSTPKGVLDGEDVIKKGFNLAKYIK